MRAIALSSLPSRRARRAWLFCAALAAAGLAVRTWDSPAEAKTDPRTYNLKKKVFGKSVPDWTVEWWQWFTSIPASVHPMRDETGEFVEVGQRGPVWFLGGVFNISGVAVRTATIPTGKSLFFPVINGNWDNTAENPPIDEPEMRNRLREVIAAVNLESLEVELDGSLIQGVASNRVASPVFAIALPEDNIFRATGVSGAVRGVWSPVVSDGYWVFLKPLESGPHTLRFRGSAGTPANFALDITYNLSVVERNRP